jgi:Fe-S oxidoreductase
VIKAVCNNYVDMERSTIMESTFCCGGGGGLLTDDLMGIRIKSAMPRMQALKEVEKTGIYFAVSFSTDASSTSSDGASSVCGLS